MTTTQLIYSLSKPVHHVGFTFHFAIKPIEQTLYVGFFLVSCHSKKKDKKTAFDLGFWTDKNPSTHTSSVNTPLLTGIPLFSDDDDELNCTLKALLNYLNNHFSYSQPLSNRVEETEYSEIKPLQIHSPKFV